MKETLWYTLKVFGGQEEAVKAAIEKKLQDSDAGAYVVQVFFPVTEVYEVKKKERTFKPTITGYIFIEVVAMNSKIQQLFRNIPNFLGFLTDSGYSKSEDPVPMTKGDLQNLKRKSEESIHTDTQQYFKIGDSVKVIEGPFKDSSGQVSSVYKCKKRLCVVGLFADMSVPVELSFSKVIKND